MNTIIMVKMLGRDSNLKVRYSVKSKRVRQKIDKIKHDHT